MEKGCTERELRSLTELLRTIFEDVSLVELPQEKAGHWQDDAMQVSYEQGGGQVSCVLRRRVQAEGRCYGLQMSAPLAGNTLPEDRMTERERELVREDMNRDFLTGVYNRRYIETVLCKEIEADARAGVHGAVALVSLDEADRLRCEYGQPALDQIICTMANQWKKHCAGTGSKLVCRLHGGILLIACRGLTAAQLEAEMTGYYAGMPRDCVAGIGMMNRVAFTLSIGVAGTAELDWTQCGWEDLYHLCDGRMRAAVAAGGNCIRAAR